MLVGHSWGDTLISAAGVHYRVVGLVYVSALAPDAGETTAQLYQGFAPTPEFVIDTRPDGFGFVRSANFKAGFATDVSDADAAFMAAPQVPIKMAAFGERLQHAAWRTKPSWALIATEDKAFDQAMLLHMAKRVGADIITVPGSHALFIAQSQTVSDVIDRAATKAKSRSTPARRPADAA
ncbi:alpha/beta fold hydrolase [Xanthomonas vasicola]|uniref:alpha/beta fold hydrolase n=1 Tax=Xanthomonas vasicola TaxID=56459 RepID=UPI0009B85ED5